MQLQRLGDKGLRDGMWSGSGERNAVIGARCQHTEDAAGLHALWWGAPGPYGLCPHTACLGCGQTPSQTLGVCERALCACTRWWGQKPALVIVVGKRADASQLGTLVAGCRVMDLDRI